MMLKFDLQVRNLTTGERGLMTFDSVAAAKSWLTDRPKNTEVMGMASHHIPNEVVTELRAAMRPLDAEEKVLEQQLAMAQQAELRARAEERRKRETEEVEKHRREMKSADVNRPMELRYTFHGTLDRTDADDPRPISDEARQAVTEWIAERNSWVEGRGQVVGDAKIQVWPGPIPEGKGPERVISGTFVPVSAPEKKDPHTLN